jgi:hypothetical protein
MGARAGCIFWGSVTSGETPIRLLSPSAILRLLVALPLLTILLSGQQQNPSLTVTRTHRITQISEAIHVDGRLDERAWSQVQPITGFVQADPVEGAPASERTEAYLFYDERKIYFGFKCYESEPKKIIGRLDTHDARTNSDSVNIFLDPYGDRRTGYFFSINARGGQFDGLVSEASGMDGTWDGIWESAARIEDWGWTAEVAIPFKSIRLTPGQTWGLNLSRDIVRKNESAYWQFVARFESFPPRPSKAGLLEGIEQVERGRNLEVIPYFSTRTRRGAVSPIDNGEQYEGGVDVRWGLLPNATLNVTVNPDFAETEADEANISISRFEIFFPEKRAFFNEGSTFFTTPLSLFFTRRVGARLPDGQPQRILLGAKLTGKVQGWSLGMLEARTEETRFRDPSTGAQMTSPAANFFVLRMQRDIFRNSTIGFLTVNRDQQDGDLGSTQRVHAVDLSIISGPYLKWSNQAAYNQNETTGEGGIHRAALRSNFNYATSSWEVRGRYKYVGRGFDVSEIGFEPETNRHSGAAAVKWQPFIDRGGIRQIFFEINQDIDIDTSGLTQDSGSDVDLSARLQNFWFARVRYSYDLVRFNEFTTTPNCPPPFGCSPAFGRLSPTRAYIEPRLRFFLNSNENRAWYFNYEFLWRKLPQFRENFYGREQKHFLSVTGRLFGRTRVQFNGTWIRELLQDGTPFQMRRQFLARVQHQFTRKLRVRTLAQVTNDRLGQNFSMNSIVAYDFTARSAAIVGYNYQKRAPGFPGDLGNEFFAKFSYLFQF